MLFFFMYLKFIFQNLLVKKSEETSVQKGVFIFGRKNLHIFGTILKVLVINHI